MANTKSQIKRNRQNDRRGMRNKAIRSALKSTAKRVRSAAESGDGETAGEQLRMAARQIDKAVAKGALHKRSAARRKSRLARAVGSGTDAG